MSNQTSRQLTDFDLFLTGAVEAYAPVTAAGVASSAGGYCVGLSMTNGSSGNRIRVRCAGPCRAVAGATVNAGDLLEVGSTVSRLVPRTAGVAVARALTGGANGDFIEVLFMPN